MDYAKLVRFYLFSLRDQVKNNGIRVLIAFFTALIIISCVIVLGIYTKTPLSNLSRDFAAVANVKIYTSLLSNFGIFIWIATTAITFFTYFQIKSIISRDRTAGFLLASGSISLILTADDAFLFHEEIFPHMLHFPEKGIYLIYFLLFTAFFLYYQKRLHETDYIFLILFIFFLGLSVSMDAVLKFSDLEAFSEDCLKFVGIVMWFSYFYKTCGKILKEAYTKPSGRVR